MKMFTRYTACGVLAALIAIGGFWYGPATAEDPGEETAGNNLSYPVIWAEGVTKPLRTPDDFTTGPNPDEVTADDLKGEWWYSWGPEVTEPSDIPLNCLPDPDNNIYCDDNIAGNATTALQPGDGWVKAYLQKDSGNTWQAGTFDGSETTVVVDDIDWGDNLESVDWYTRSQVRAEVVLYKGLKEPMLEYEMRHVSGWGISEVHGLAVDQGNMVEQGTGSQATIYSPCARLTIQKLLVDPLTVELIWVPGDGWTKPEGSETELINAPILNMAVHEAEDGPGYYNAEINVKGKIIYGYTWNVRKLNDKTVNGGEAAGVYRITFSFDGTCGGASLNTFFEEGTTEILVPLEEELDAALAAETDGTGGGGVPVIDFTNNLTYIDVRILERETGGSGGGDNGGPHRPDDTGKDAQKASKKGK
ncbi:hypothetical protein DSLASN_13030 [Desulfoluna limicola]|uniref:Uncharacterized protein n=1 Tax=Desulfoluna limicola TaxID=2810562 RepID=A0ABN6F242_9BACT|nr:hypothetical protein [Desulfoluna limicola]BCS95671.1 hypothetical protein DSLASN_13030 [Desulfoluna limicola]